MIKVDGKLTGWEDTARSMILAAREVSRGASRHTIASDTGGSLSVVGKSAYTSDNFLVEAAKKMGLKVKEDDALMGMEIFL